MWMYYHTEKWEKDREVQKGDRVLFYETRNHPEEERRGEETIFAVGTVKKKRGERINPPRPSGGKRWNWKREVAARVVPPAAGVSMSEIRKALKWGNRATLRRSPMRISGEEFRRIEVLLAEGRRTFRNRIARKTGFPRQQDPDKRAQLERAAVNEAIRWYRKQGFKVESVEKDNLGWDLEAKSASVTWKIEVKGLSGSEVAVELTPNEFSAMRKVSLRPVYRLFVVTHGLSRPKGHEFFYSGKDSCWKDREHRILEIRRVVGARARVV